MSSTRYRQQPMQIYQDPVSYDHAPMPSMNCSTPKTSSPLRPIKNASSRTNVVFNPPSMAPSKPSPLKPAHQSSSSPSRAPFSNKLNMISMPPPGALNYHTDSMEKKQLNMTSFKTGPQKALFTTFSTARPTGKENYQPPSICPAPSAYGEGIAMGNFSIDGMYGQKPQGKRVLMEATPMPESRPLKKVKIEPEVASQATEKLPLYLPDDGSKPGHSYAMLIGMAILRAPNRRLTLAQIYKWISDTYSYYSVSEPGWQNSIRHNLSLNKAFVKQERPKDDPGKGNYWAIEVGMESQFFKDKGARKAMSNNDNGSLLISSTPVRSQEPAQPTFKSLVPAQQELPPSSSFMPSEAAAPAGADLSSDATIPASDAFAPEEEQEEEDPYLAPSFSQPIHSSPPAPMMHSSPPVARHIQARDDTPPPVPRFPSSSRNRSHKRNFASMDDSGYFSSLNSSVLRGPHHDHQLTSEADRPRIKRGRAEEEIARLRGSSYDSPTKIRSIMAQVNSFAPPSSSPIRRGISHDASTAMLPPLTPVVKLKAPMRPPPSVSPNTNLRMHRDRVRQLVGSPDRGITTLDDGLSWSPAFQIDEAYMSINFDAEFDIFADVDTNFLTIPGSGSPEKRSAKRPRIERSSSANALADISNMSNRKNITSQPSLKGTPMLAPSAFDSPTKLLGLDSPSKQRSPTLSISAFDLPQEDFLGSEFLSEELTEFSGVDILQTFKRIGAGGSGNRFGQNGNRPGLGRSFTSRF